jgi:hypothetical protein
VNAAAGAAPKKWGRAVWPVPPATPMPGSAGDSRLMGDAPDRSVAVFGHEERTILATATPTGQPQTCLSEITRPVMKSSYAPALLIVEVSHTKLSVAESYRSTLPFA